MRSWASFRLNVITNLTLSNYDIPNSDSLQLTFDHDTNSWTQGVCLLHWVSGENCPPVSMDVLTNGVPNQGEQDKRESEMFSTYEKTIYSFWKELVRMAMTHHRSQKSFFLVPKQQNACHETRKFSRETSNTHPANDKCFGVKKQQAMNERHFGKRFRRKNNDNHAVNVDVLPRNRKMLPEEASVRRLGAKYSGHVWQMLTLENSKLLDNLPIIIFTDNFSQPKYFFPSITSCRYLTAYHKKRLADGSIPVEGSSSNSSSGSPSIAMAKLTCTIHMLKINKITKEIFTY